MSDNNLKPTQQELDDYIKDTDEHIGFVRHWVAKFNSMLKANADIHDDSKYEEPELSIYARVRPLMNATEYGSTEYRIAGRKLGSAWKHHKQNNPHHPDHWENGVNDMNLVLIIEMLCDWKSASQRNPNQDFRSSLEYNIDRYKIGEQLGLMLIKTAEDMGMMNDK